MAKEIRFLLDAPIEPQWSNAELLRTAIVNCLAALFYNNDLSESVGIIAGELVENAIKYGDWTSNVENAFRFSVNLEGHKLTIDVYNPIAQNDDGYKNVLETVKWIQGFASPQEAYTAKLLEIAQRPKGSNLSNLGLPRIAYEGNCRLAAEVIDGRVLHIRATSVLENVKLR